MKLTITNRLAWKLALLLLSITLLTLSFVFNKIYSNRSSVTGEVLKAEQYIHGAQRDFNKLILDTIQIKKLIEDRETKTNFDKVTGKNYGVFLYKVSSSGILSLNFWNTQLILPPEQTFARGDMEEYMKLLNGYYLVVKRTIFLSDYSVVAYAMIPIRSLFFVATDYSNEKFVYSNTADRRVVLVDDRETEFPVHSLSGYTLFYLDTRDNSGIMYNSTLTLMLRFAGLLIFLLFIHLIAESLALIRLWRGVVFLGVCLIAIRVAIYSFPQLLNLRQFELFDPSIYGSNLIQRSLGDLLVNSTFLCWFILFTWYKVQHFANPTQKFPNWLKWVSGIFSVCLLIYSTFIISSVIRSIVADSKISFDVTNFSSLNQYTVVGFIVLATLTLSYYYLTQLLFRIIFQFFKENTWPVYFAIAFSGLVYLSIKSGDSTVLFYIPVLAWLLIYTWLVNRNGLIVYRLRINIAGILFWISVFSVSIAAIMVAENRKAELGKRQFYAEKLVTQTDKSSERVMSIALGYLNDKFLTDNFGRFTDSSQSISFRDSIYRTAYPLYLDKFAPRFYVYDSSGFPLFNPVGAPSFEALNTIVTQQAYPTFTTDLYYYEISFDKFTYITQKTIRDSSGAKLGYFFIISNPKKYGSDALDPELFRQYRRNDPENSSIYSYAVYSRNRLITYSNKYPFATELSPGEQPVKEVEKRTNGEYDELWYRAANQKVVIMARKRDTLIESITLFSYIFCSFLFLVFVVQVFSLGVRAAYDIDSFKRFFHFNIRNQVHSTIIFVSIFSFIIIGIATINFFRSRYNRTNSDKLSQTMKIMVSEMEKKFLFGDEGENLLRFSDSSSMNALTKLIGDVSDVHGVDVNVYDLNGNLQVSSEPNIYEKGVLSKKIEPTAYFNLSRLNRVEHVQDEHIADLYYKSIYAPVRDEQGKVRAYLGIPYFTSQTELNQEISNFIVTVINLNAFILLKAGLIALFITNRITRSFSVIGDKMKEVNLGKHNEEIIWNRDDEIGDLVTEYNKMVTKLGESASALAKTEREGAWREMARQVAHEIKNPLTPMKLSIQYLQKAINSNQPNVKELSSSVANTLVEQIDHLAKIAADFSQFANIGQANNEELDLHEVLRSLTELFRSDPNTQIEWLPLNRTLMVVADKTQMNRLFTNLFANAIEACQDNACHIRIREQLLQDNMVRISITDNGEGIAQEMQSRIFIPNFTTKSSGTGLGLAMCKGIVEQSKGNIWFQTELGHGTTFHVELPLTD